MFYYLLILNVIFKIKKNTKLNFYQILLYITYNLKNSK